MKKIIIIILTFLLLILASCSSDDRKQDSVSETSPASSDASPTTNPIDQSFNNDQDSSSNTTQENDHHEEDIDEPIVEPDVPLERINLEIDIEKYLDKSIFNIDFNSYKYMITDIRYAVNRAKDTVIVFDEANPVNTNIYGWEVGVDRYGTVISYDVNVTIPSGGFVISGHGSGNTKVKKIEIGDYILYYGNTVYVYDNEFKDYNPVILTLYELISSIDQIEDIKLYNEYVTILNNLENSLDLFYSGDISLKNTLLNELNKIIIPKINVPIHYHSYNYTDLNIPLYDKSSVETCYQPFVTFTDLKDGGSRLRNYMVLYNENNLVERNTSGMEIAIDKDGYVIQMDTLVAMPEGGHIISGHLDSRSFLETNVSLYDKIVIDGSSFTVYKDYVHSKEIEYIKKRNDLLQKAIIDDNNDIPHDYNYIKYLIGEIDKNLDELIKIKTIYFMLKANDILNNLEALTLSLRANLISNSINEVKGMWYYPFKTLYEKDLESVKENIKLFKEIGINRLIVSPWYGNYTLMYNSTDFVTYPELDNYDYGEYGHDYLKCLVTEAHKAGISIGIIDGTFAEKIKGMKSPDNSLYQIEYSGEKSQGNIYYLDICNDKVQDLKYQFYIDLVSNYDLDFVEYDIVRYSASNLRSFKGEITDPSKIVDPGWTDYSINKFKTLYNISGNLKKLILTNVTLRETWMQFKQNEIDNFLLRVSSDMRSINPNIKISAATLKNYENAKTNYLQDFRKWHEMGILDRIEGMNYTDSMKDFISHADSYFSDPDFSDIALGIMTTERYTALDQIDESFNYNGYVLYSSGVYLVSSKNPFTDALISNHHSEFISELSSSVDIYKAKTDDIIDMIEGYYAPKYNIDFSWLVDALKDYHPNKSKSYVKRIKIDSIKEYITKKIEE